MADKKSTKKNKKSYDNKLITWISVSLGAFVAIVVAIVLIKSKGNACFATETMAISSKLYPFINRS